MRPSGAVRHSQVWQRHCPGALAEVGMLAEWSCSTPQKYTRPIPAYGLHVRLLQLAVRQMKLGLPPEAHFSIEAEEPNRLASTKEPDMKTLLRRLPDHRLWLGHRGVLVCRVLAIVLIVFVTGSQK